MIVAHRLDTIARADQVVFVEAGRVVELGTPKELLSADGRFAAYWRQRHSATSWHLGRV
ncbi:hypothetical protein [Stackebrandtia soli]|uniref:hypothetical protein n=1 Tax=Stackebrandtia soli TaxID=1892856 RepID=UPI0039EAFA6A